MRILFRVDSSVEMGLGHVMRCLTFAENLSQKGHEITFACRYLNGNPIDLLRQKGYRVLTLSGFSSISSDNAYERWLGVSQVRDAEQTISALPFKIDLLIVDHYALDAVWHKKVRYCTDRIMVIDDLADRDFDCDVVLNQSLGVQICNYESKIPKHCRLLLGSEYAMLRPEFSRLRRSALKRRENTQSIRNILISLGGSDSDNHTYRLLKNISDSFNVVVVLGRLSPNRSMIEEYAKDRNISVIVNAENMGELMLDADLSIGAGGSTSWERCCLGLPTLLLVTADNQKVSAHNLESLGAVKIIENFQEDLDSLVNNLDAWRKMSERASAICDGKGVDRIVI